VSSLLTLPAEKARLLGSTIKISRHPSGLLEIFSLFKILFDKRQHGVLIGTRRDPDLCESERCSSVCARLTDAQGGQAIGGQTFRQLAKNPRGTGGEKHHRIQGPVLQSGLGFDGQLFCRLDCVERAAADSEPALTEQMRKRARRILLTDMQQRRVRRRPVTGGFGQRFGITIGAADITESGGACFIGGLRTDGKDGKIAPGSRPDQGPNAIGAGSQHRLRTIQHLFRQEITPKSRLQQRRQQRLVTAFR